MTILTHNHSSLPPDFAPSLHDLLAQQERAGCDVLTDGFYHARDPVWLALESVSGAHAGPPVDYFGAGFEVPAPLVREHLHYHRDVAVTRWLEAQGHTNRPVKAVLPGPFTLACLGDPSCGPYESREALAEAWATALLPAFAALVDAGARWVQIEEPAILREPQSMRFLRDLLEPFWQSRETCRIVVSTWGPGASAVYAQLHSLPADLLGVDAVADKELLDLVPAVGASQELCLGLVRPDTQPASTTVLLRGIDRILHNYPLGTLHLGPACGLESVPGPVAFAALQELATAAKKVSNCA